MDSLQILRNLRKNVNNAFYGVFPSDRLPQHVIDRPAYIVANTDPAHKSGTHWVAFYIPKRGNIEYFDSFGKRPEDKNFLKFIRNNKAKNKCFKHNSKCLQSDYSSLCGHYCCVYLIHRKNGRSLKHFLSNFQRKNRDMNDQIIARMYKNIFVKEKTNVKRRKRERQTGGQSKKIIKCPSIICNQICRSRL